MHIMCLKGKAKHARENVTQSLSKKNSSSSSSPKLSPSKTAPLIQTELDLNASQDGSMIGNDDNNEKTTREIGTCMQLLLATTRI